jgi:hypothetical protein
VDFLAANIWELLVRVFFTLLIFFALSLPMGWIYLGWKKDARSWREMLRIIRENFLGRTEDDSRFLLAATYLILLLGSVLYSATKDVYYQGLAVEIMGGFIGFYFLIVLQEIIRPRPRVIEESPQNKLKERPKMHHNRKMRARRMLQ